MFVVKLTEMNVIPGVELFLWKHILIIKMFAFVNCVWKFDGNYSSTAIFEKTKA